MRLTRHTLVVLCQAHQSTPDTWLCRSSRVVRSAHSMRDTQFTFLSLFYIFCYKLAIDFPDLKHSFIRSICSNICDAQNFHTYIFSYLQTHTLIALHMCSLKAFTVALPEGYYFLRSKPHRYII